jgi:DNA-binding MarR family transcriptional regulator
MELNDIRTLTILEKVQDDRPLTQRDLARELNISVGLVNSFIKRLAKKGYVKVTTIPRNRIRYILTPQGMAEKTRLTYAYIQYSYQFYKQARHKLRQLFSELEAKGVRRIVFLGATDLAEIAYLSLQETAIDLAAVADDRREGTCFHNTIVKDISDLKATPCDRILITDERDTTFILDKLRSHDIPRNKVELVR